MMDKGVTVKTHEFGCDICRTGLDFEFSFAFQPIIDVGSGRVFSYEALVRGINGEPARFILDKVDDGNRYRFDQACRVRAIELAARLGVSQHLNINFMPNAIYRPELCIRTTLEAADTHAFPVERLILEVIEGEQVEANVDLENILRSYRQLGLKTALDDFGAGYSGLNLLAEYHPDFIKLDRKLISNIHENPRKQAIVKGIVQVCRDLEIIAIAEGIETAEEYRTLRDAGISLLQGYYFARPAFESLPKVDVGLLD